MANVVREDIVKISFEIADNPLSKLTAGMDKLKASVAVAESGLDGIKDTAKKAAAGVEGIKDAAKGIKDIAKAADEAKEELGGVEQSAGEMRKMSAAAQGAKNAIQSFNRGCEMIKSIPSRIKSVASAVKTNISNAFVTARLNVAAFVTTLKTVTKIKIKNIANGFKELKSVLTEGKSGLKGFVTSLKNIGKISISKTVSGLKSLKNIGTAGVSKLFDALKKVAGVSFSALHKGIEKIGSLAKTAGSAVLKGLGKTATVAAKGISVAVGAGVTGLSALTVKSLNAAGELEQNIGGAETVFGGLGDSISAMSAPIQTYNAALGTIETSTANLETVSKNAFTNMGLSQSDYLATANKMGALFKGSGFEQQEALNMSTQAMQRAADVASIMGIDINDAMESIAGAAKGNFTMMDNLGVAINDTTLKAYAQEKGLGELKTTQDKVGAAMAMFMDRTADYAGNYAKENQTLAGSLQTAKSAMTNFLSGAGDAGQVVEAVGGAAKVIAGQLPGTVSRITSGIGQIAKELGPQFVSMIQVALPQIITAAVELVNTLAGQLPDIISTALPSILSGMAQVVGGILDVLSASGPQITLTIISGLNSAVMSLLGMLPQFVIVAGKIIIAITQGLTQAAPSLIPAIVQGIMSMIDTIGQMLPQLVIAGLQLLIGLTQGVVAAIPQLVAAIPTIITNFVNAVMSNLPTIIQLGIQLIVMLAVGLIQAIPQLLSAIPQIISALWNGLTSVNWLDLGKKIISSIGSGITNGIKSLFGIGEKAGKGAADGVSSGISAGTPQAQLSASTLAASTVPSFAAIGNTSQFGTAAADNLAMGITAGTGTVQFAASNMASMAASSMQLDTGAMMMNGQNAAADLASGITASAGAAVAAAGNMASGVETAGQADVAVNISVDQSGLAAASGAVNSFVAETQSAVEQIPPAFDTAMGTAVQTTTAKMTEIGTAVQNGMKDCLTAVKNGMSQILTAVNSVNLSAAGANMISGLVNGINSRKAAAVAAARSVANSVNAEFNKIQKIHSPSKVWEEKGKFLIQGGVIGMEKQMPKMQAAAREAGEISVPYLGNYTPENSGSTYYSRSNSEEYNSYAPVFNLTINGGSEDDRSLARKVKRFVKEGIEDTFESLNRKQPKPRRA